MPAPPVASVTPAVGAGGTGGASGVLAAAGGGVRAPNVTVTARGLLEADAHIRVLTPSEIMRTLPRLPRHTVPRHATPRIYTTHMSYTNIPHHTLH